LITLLIVICLVNKARWKEIIERENEFKSFFLLYYINFIL
jgi:hypothetical protein